jgi:antitoxin HigA-1
MSSRKPTHPGIVLYEDFMKPNGITITIMAEEMGISRKTMSELANGKCSLTADMAIRIAIVTNTKPGSWYLMQCRLDLWKAEKDFHSIGMGRIISAFFSIPRVV